KQTGAHEDDLCLVGGGGRKLLGLNGRHRAGGAAARDDEGNNGQQSVDHLKFLFDSSCNVEESREPVGPQGSPVAASAESLLHSTYRIRYSEHMRLKGRIRDWRDDKGFGFIEPEGGGARVFAHARAFANRQRRPEIGAQVTYLVGTDERG